MSLLLAPLLAGGCSISNLPVAGTKQTPNLAEASPTPRSAGQRLPATPTFARPVATSTTGAGSSGQPVETTPVPQPGGQGAPWQIPAEQQAVVQVVERAGPAVVTVVNKLDSLQGFSGEARGSGVIIDTDGRILTNNHVVEGASQGGLTVIFSNGESSPAQVVGTDQISDLAVLKVDVQVPATAQLGDSEKLKVGETVIAIGSALGDFQNTGTVGEVSGVNRTLKGDYGVNIENMFQTDAAINHCNSGGPLLNLSGEVIGVNTAVVRNTSSSGLSTDGDVAEGLGFAIPANTVKSVTTQLIETGKVTRPYLGVVTRPLSAALASYYKLRDENGNLLDKGVLVSDVADNSGAAKAGVEAGDVIQKIDDTVLDDDHPLVNVLMTHKPGDTVTLTIVRSGKTTEVQAKLGVRP